MSLFTETEFRALGATSAEYKYKAAASVLTEDANVLGVERKSFDVFLSHSFKDAAIVLGIKTFFENQGLVVYVDWISDPDLDRENVTVATADRLRARMRQSKSLIYAHSNNSPSSKWMSWELGYFDGYKGVVAILPIAKTTDESFSGQEFLGLYPYIDKSDLKTIWINRGKVPKSAIGATENNFVTFRNWLQNRAGVSLS